MTVKKAILCLETLLQIHLSHSNGMKEFANEPGRTADMKEIGWMISQNHEGMAKVLKAVIKDLKSEQDVTKPRKKTKRSKKR